ncbi:UNVERIFIED_CONTAM: hypothetical protein PYX00_007966 [Menopon gallinae]|uniref:CYRIA/CYRIB Rac1 binding domain-containing protein n=1 Tax=Menopon gallinae TaxID=328185 RepID=A0AAW2HLF4_9NEOP
MGKLLSLLARDDSNCCSPQKYDVFLDFENAQPTEGEKTTFEEVDKVFCNSSEILNELQCYKGAGREIREAIACPSEETQKQAWNAVLPLVAKLKKFYQFSTQLEKVVPKILAELCSGEMSPTQHLETQQALVKQLAEILEFVLKFDELKMKTPAIQNDFSYYRRTLTWQRMSVPQEGYHLEDTKEISNELAYRMSLFYAHATPMLKVLTEATMTFVLEHTEIPKENITETLSTMAKVCLRMLENPNLIAQFQREETQLFVLRVMVGLVILYDHVHPNGAFVKASNLDLKGCVKLLKDQPASRSEGLLNALRYANRKKNFKGLSTNINNI